MTDLLERVRARAERNSFWQYLGIRVEEAEPGRIRLRLAVKDDLRNAPGRPVHGGVYATLVDAAVGGAIGTVREDSEGGVAQTTLDLNVTFVSAARGDELIAEGRILKHGRTVVFGETRVLDADGTLVATGRATYMLLPPKA